MTSKSIDRLLVIWKSDLSDKSKHNFFQAVVASILLYGCTKWTLTKYIEKKMTVAQECYELYLTNPSSNMLQKSSCMVTYLASLKPFKSDKQDMRYSAGEVRASS